MLIFVRRVAVAAYAIGLLVIAVLSLLPQVDLPGPDDSDKVAHLLAYAMIALTVGFGFVTRSARIYAAVLAFAVGLALELAQGFVPNRDPSVLDALANGTGVLLGLLAGTALRRRAAGARGDRLSDTNTCDTPQPVASEAPRPGNGRDADIGRLP